MILYTLTFIGVALWVISSAWADKTDPYWDKLKQFYNDDKKDL
jgi:hypothetical protein